MTTQVRESEAETRRFENTSRQANGSSLVGRRTAECLAMCMIGDGALAFVEPQRHAKLWLEGPEWWQKILRPFVERPQLTRWLGAAEFACGFWLASQQRPDDSEREFCC